MYIFCLACPKLFWTVHDETYNAFNVYRRELAPGTVSLTGDRAQGDDSKHWAYSSTRACRQTNSFEGGFVRKFLFSFLFFKIIFPSYFF